MLPSPPRPPGEIDINPLEFLDQWLKSPKARGQLSARRPEKIKGMASQLALGCGRHNCFPTQDVSPTKRTKCIVSDSAPQGHLEGQWGPMRGGWVETGLLVLGGHGRRKQLLEQNISTWVQGTVGEGHQHCCVLKNL